MLLLNKDTGLVLFFKECSLLLLYFVSQSLKSLVGQRVTLSPLTGGNWDHWAGWLFLSLWWKLMKEPKLASLSSSRILSCSYRQRHFTLLLPVWSPRSSAPPCPFLLLSDLPKAGTFIRVLSAHDLRGISHLPISHKEQAGDTRHSGNLFEGVSASRKEPATIGRAGKWVLGDTYGISWRKKNNLKKAWKRKY